MKNGLAGTPNCAANLMNRKSSGCTVSTEDFRKSFENVPKLVLRTPAEIRTKFENIKNILSNTNEDWSKRHEQLKLIRSIIIYGENLIDQQSMVSHVLDLVHCLNSAVRDLRSQILREAAITCSFIISKYGQDAHTIGEEILSSAMAQVAVSTKIMATSAAALTAFIVEFIQTRQVFAIISTYSTSKDKNQRRQLAELLDVIIAKWNERIKKQILRQLAELIRSAICDADSETRIAGRRAFARFDELHPTEADAIFLSLEPAKQKLLRAGDAASSCASVGSERGSTAIRSKLPRGVLSNTRFLAQRSASAIDPNFVRVPSSRLLRPTSSKAVGRTDLSPGGGGRKPEACRDASPPRKPRRSIGQSPFLSSLSVEEANELQRAMKKARDQLRQPSRNEDDDFLLPMLQPKPRSPARLSDSVEETLKRCTSSSSAEKREGVRSLYEVVSNPNLSDIEVKNIGSILNRLLSDPSNNMILEAYAQFIRVHHQRLNDWLRLAFAKLFAKMGADQLPATRRQFANVLTAILESFDPLFQLGSVCELMCDPIHLMVPKARCALLEYLFELFTAHIERGSLYNRKEVVGSVRKMFAWMSDQRHAALLTPPIERLFCAMFAVNSAQFADILKEFDADHRQWAYRIVQKKGFDESSINCSSELRIPELARTPKKSTPTPSLGAFLSFDASSSTTSSSADMPNLNSTVELSEETLEQKRAALELIARMGRQADPQDQHQALTVVLSMMTEGSFDVWEANYAKLLLTTFEILSKSEWEANKKLALRVISKMCTAQASRLFDSTEIAVCKVLDVAVDSKDVTTTVAVEDCLRTLATHLPLPKIINIAQVILNEPLDDQRASLILKMVAKMFEDLQHDELVYVLDDIVPCVTKAYNSTSSSARKNVIYCLVAILNKVGGKRMDHFLEKMPKPMINLIHVYVNRAISNSASRL
ncbi:unnamed protein product [Caenorhabditis bovis]|uniref:TOG domain-containing protein n=1 Tax=Caenorhabditis bovis TaxID=2654633 RepID=A0A8S1EHB2_9PELO|nr:unnamed protein product [Caenorhabditis bovis]